MPWKYTKCHRSRPEGFIFLGHEKQGACTITLVPAASMTQIELDSLGEEICNAVNKARGKRKKRLTKVSV